MIHLRFISQSTDDCPMSVRQGSGKEIFLPMSPGCSYAKEAEKFFVGGLRFLCGEVAQLCDSSPLSMRDESTKFHMWFV